MDTKHWHWLEVTAKRFPIVAGWIGKWRVVKWNHLVHRVGRSLLRWCSRHNSAYSRLCNMWFCHESLPSGYSFYVRVSCNNTTGNEVIHWIMRNGFWFGRSLLYAFWSVDDSHSFGNSLMRTRNVSLFWQQISLVWKLTCTIQQRSTNYSNGKFYNVISLFNFLLTGSCLLLECFSLRVYSAFIPKQKYSSMHRSQKA